MHVTKLMVITLLLTIGLVANAQESTGGEPPYRLTYENSPDLPNGIAFYMTLLTLDSFNTEFGPADPAEWVAQELEMNIVDSHAFVSQALTTLYLINTDVRAQEERLACEFVAPGVSKKDKYAALQQTYDIHKAVYDHYYDQTKAGLDADTGERLQEWMDEQKLNTSHMEFDFEKMDQQTGRDSTVWFSKLCKEVN